MIDRSSRVAAVDCPREADVFEAVAYGRWPDHVSRDLLAHAAACAVCGDLVEVAAALRADREALLREARPPSAALVWWRAAIRARADAARIAMQPVALWHRVAAVCTAGVAAAVAGSAWRSTAAGGAADLFARFVNGQADAGSVIGFGVQHAAVLVAAVVACLLAAPVALYLALDDEKN
jgi:hypothetical protein